MCSVTKRDIMKALCEWGCHGEAVPEKWHVTCQWKCCSNPQRL